MKTQFFPDIDEDKYSAGFTQEKEGIENTYSGISLAHTVDEIRRFLTEKHPQLFQSTLSNDLSRKKIKDLITDYIKERSIKIEGIYGLQNTIQAVTSEILDFGVITEYINNEEVEEIRINSFDDIRIVVGGREYKSGRKFSNKGTAINIAKKIVRTVGKNLSSSSPIIDARIDNGQRVACIIEPLALNGINLTIRKQKKTVFSAEKLIEFGSLNRDMIDFLDIVGESELSCMIVGPTNSGKTATLQSLISRLVYRQPGRRIITMEDTAELNLKNVIAWETRKNSSLLDLLIHSLRQSPETLVLGEMRGSEAQTIVAAANTGHQVYNTFHASGPEQAPRRILQMYMMGDTTLTQSMILDMIVDAFPICVYQKKLKDGTRRVMSISEIVGIENNDVVYNEIFKYVAKDTVEEKIQSTYSSAEGKYNRIIGEHIFASSISERLYSRFIESGISRERVDMYRGGKGD